MRDGLDDFLAELCDPLYRFLLRLTGNREQAADLAQEALLRAWKSRTSLQDPRLRRVWAFRVAANLAKDHHRHKRTTRRVQQEWSRPVGSVPRPEDQLAHHETRAKVTQAVDQLPSRQREVMHLLLVEELTPTEIGEVLGIDSHSVRSNLAAARKTLRTNLSDLAPDVGKSRTTSPQAAQQ